MANSFTAHENSIIEFFICTTVALTSMEQHLELIAAPLFGCKDLLKEVINAFVVVFLVNHIEGAYHIILVVYALLNRVQHSLDVTFA